MTSAEKLHLAKVMTLSNFVTKAFVRNVITSIKVFFFDKDVNLYTVISTERKRAHKRVKMTPKGSFWGQVCLSPERLFWGHVYS